MPAARTESPVFFGAGVTFGVSFTGGLHCFLGRFPGVPGADFGSLQGLENILALREGFLRKK